MHINDVLHLIIFSDNYVIIQQCLTILIFSTQKRDDNAFIKQNNNNNLIYG